jgi:hypothetical protein
MIADEEQQLRGFVLAQAQALGDFARHFEAGFGMVFHVGGFADIVQQQREVEHVRMFELLKNLLVAGVRRFRSVDDAVKELDNLNRMIVPGV